MFEHFHAMGRISNTQHEKNNVFNATKMLQNCSSSGFIKPSNWSLFKGASGD